MLRRSFLLAASATIIAGPVAASSPPAPAENQSYVDISPVGLPIVIEGRLVNYVFVSVRLWARAGTDVTELRAREPRFRDALVRLGHRRSLATPRDSTRIDELALTRALAPDATRIAGGPVFQRIEVRSQTPQRRQNVHRRN